LIDDPDVMLAFGDMTDNPGPYALFFKERNRPLYTPGADDKHHSYPHVEGPKHFLICYLTGFLNLPENRRDGPGSHLNDSRHTRGKYSGDVFIETAPRNMGHSFDSNFLLGFEEGARIDSGWPQQFLPYLST
jgi:hypothetical protein